MNSGANPIRVLIADDSAFMRSALSRMVSSDPALQVIGTAVDGVDALEKTIALNPDVVTLDIQMPRIDGLEALRRIMAQSPRPVVIVSSLTHQNAEATLTALAIGAFDCVSKQPDPMSLDIDHLRDVLVASVKAAADSRRRAAPPQSPRKPVRSVPESPAPSTTPAVIAIGTSTGGPKALQEILPQLPGDLGIPILIVQHMPVGFTTPFARRLDTLCQLRVREASHGAEVDGSVIYVAPAGMHMTVFRSPTSKARIVLSSNCGGKLHVPSVDVLMLSVAEHFGPQAMGVIMTGMGADGLEGMRAIHRRGGFTIGQDEASSAVYGMPKVCFHAGCLLKTVALEEIPKHILLAARYRRRA